MTTWIQFSWVILRQTTSNNLTPAFNHGCLFSEKLYTYGRNILLKVFHSHALISLRSLGAYPSDRGTSYQQAWCSAFTVLEPEIHSYPWDVLRDSAFTVPLWRLISLPENHKEMMRESSFPNSLCSQYCPSLRAVKGKVSGARCLDSNAGHNFISDFGENCWNSLGLSFFICKMGVFIGPASRCTIRITWTIKIFKAPSPYLAHWKPSLQHLVDLVKVLRKTRLYLKKRKILAHYWLTDRLVISFLKIMWVLISL